MYMFSHYLIVTNHLAPLLALAYAQSSIRGGFNHQLPDILNMISFSLEYMKQDSLLKIINGLYSYFLHQLFLITPLYHTEIFCIMSDRKSVV